MRSYALADLVQQLERVLRPRLVLRAALEVPRRRRRVVPAGTAIWRSSMQVWVYKYIYVYVSTCKSINPSIYPSILICA